MRETSFEIYQLNDELLMKPTSRFSFDEYDPIHISNSLNMTREFNNGIGLAANQVGIDSSVISIRGMESALFNPKIVAFSDETTLMDEGCLSYPGLVVKMRRSEVIRLRFTDYTGNTTIKTFYGLTARVIQHEMNHLNGKFFFDGVSKQKLSLSVSRAKKKFGKDYSYILTT